VIETRYSLVLNSEFLAKWMFSFFDMGYQNQASLQRRHLLVDRGTDCSYG
jgi:hypothetical protein